MSEKAFLTIIASKRVAVSLLNGLAKAIRENSDDKVVREEYKQAMSDALSSLEANDYAIRKEPFKTFAEMINY